VRTIKSSQVARAEAVLRGRHLYACRASPPSVPHTSHSLPAAHLVSFECVDELVVAVDVPVSTRGNSRALHHAPKADEQVGPPADLNGLKVRDAVTHHHHGVVGVALTDARDGSGLALYVCGGVWWWWWGGAAG